MKPKHESLAAAVADGDTTDDLTDPADPVARNLTRLGDLAAAFRGIAGSTDEQRPSLFQWRHLQVESELGQGGFGTVYQAWDPVLKRRVALKLGRETSRSEARDRWIIAEARRMARVRHPNILAVHGADSDDGRTGIWCDLIEGETLQQVLDREQTLSSSSALGLALVLADALATIHERGLSHGDIKPANVMIRSDGEPILMDFGAGAEPGTPGPLAGSPIVMAPELFAGGATTAASDVYALGALLYRALCGRYPIEAEDFDQLAARHAQAMAPDLAPLPPSFRAVIGACLAIDPAGRPESREVLRTLRHLAEAPARRRRNLALGAIIGSLTLALAATAIGLWRVNLSEHRAEQARTDAEATLGFLTDMIQAPRIDELGPEVRVEEVLDGAAHELDRGALDDRQTARLRLVLGRTYLSIERRDKARTQLVEALRLAGEPPMQARALLGLIEVENGMENYDLASARINELERLAERYPEDLRIEASLVTLQRGLIAFERGERNRAAELFETFDRDPDVPDDHAARPRAWTRLAWIARDAAELERGQDYARRALEWYERHRGPDSGEAFNARNELAIQQATAGDHTSAERTIREALEVLDGIAPGPSERRVSLLNTLAATLAGQGRGQEALDATRELRDLAEQLHGRDSMAYTLISANLGVRHFELGQYEPALEITTEVLAAAREKLGPDSNQALMFAANYSEMLLYAGRTESALTAARQSYENNRRVLGENHLFTLFVADVFGAAQVRTGEVAAGMALLDDTLEAKIERFGQEHPFTWDTQAYRIEGLLRTGASGAALELARDLVEHRRATLADGDKKIAHAEMLLERAQAAG